MCNSHFCVFVCFKIPEVIRPYYELITYLIYLSWNEFLSHTRTKNKNSLIHSAHPWKEQNKEVDAFILLCYTTPIFWTLMRTQVVKTSVFGKKIKQAVFLPNIWSFYWHAAICNELPKVLKWCVFFSTFSYGNFKNSSNMFANSK